MTRLENSGENRDILLPLLVIIAGHQVFRDRAK
jgi:hypothetical protein